MLPWIQTLLSYKLEIVYIKVKELFEPIVLWKKMMGKAFYRKTDLWVMLGDYEKCKIGKGFVHLTANRLGRKEMRCAADYHKYMNHTYMCNKIFRFEI